VVVVVVVVMTTMVKMRDNYEYMQAHVVFSARTTKPSMSIWSAIPKCLAPTHVSSPLK